MKNCFWVLSPAVQEKVPVFLCLTHPLTCHLSRALFFLTVDKTLNYLSVHLSDLFWPEKFCSLLWLVPGVLSYCGGFLRSSQGGGGRFEKSWLQLANKSCYWLQRAEPVKIMSVEFNLG